ncbi:VacJ family lipoprotein [Acinetobacter sp. P8-3-8]|uniref:MlaA family lipoprotein n=1 Tax=Acinetobacter sp. P8-3-8 TaxID=1029823 RepID=UPI0002485593|nr:VacJ family lipoprotein [Acinetobacter sp. P8-3-8]
MRPYSLLWACLLSIGVTSQVSAQTNSSTQTDADETVSTATNEAVTADAIPDGNSVVEQQDSKHPRIDALKDLKNLNSHDLKVNANASQPDSVKDPLQPLNRELYQFNDMLDRNIARPLAVQYVQKVPGEVRSSYRLFRKNMGEPWNAVNQVAQGRFSRAAKSLGRFTINTITSLGLADPARRLGLGTEEESLGMTLGYYGVPSGPYLMLPILGPSTFRGALDYPAESYAKPMTYILSNNNQTGLALGQTFWSGIDSRSNLLEVEDVLQGDRYAAIRDIYLQRLAFQIAEKKGRGQEAVSFVDDDTDDTIDSGDTP